MKLWAGRFSKEEDKKTNDFNSSIATDSRMYYQDIEGSIAHVTMLAKQQILTDAERDEIIKGLKGILSDIDNDILDLDDSEHEDIHSFVEAHLIERIGNVGKKLHTGRSRNDQVALDMKLYTR